MRKRPDSFEIAMLALNLEEEVEEAEEEEEAEEAEEAEVKQVVGEDHLEVVEGDYKEKILWEKQVQVTR